MKVYLYAFRVWLYTQFVAVCLHFRWILKLLYSFSEKVDKGFQNALDKLQKELDRR
jgi:hypothetical protein